MFEEGLFDLTIRNLEYVYQDVLREYDLKPLHERNFTTIRSTNCAPLIDRVERDLNRYLHEILLELPENSKEDVPEILDLIRHDDVDHDDLRAFLERQTTPLPTLEGVPERLHAMLFELNAIEPIWVNCLDFMKGEEFHEDSLVGYLDQDIVRAAILQNPIPSDSDSLELRQFLVHASSLSDAAYREYAHALPNSFKLPPEGLEPSKLRILVDEGKITFTKESLDAFAENSDLQVLFVVANIDTYLAGPDSFALDDNFRDELLRSAIDNEAKLKIVGSMELEALVDLPERSALIGSILSKTDATPSSLTGNVARSLITHSAPVEMQISLFNKYHSLMTTDEVHQVLANLPKPFSEIKTGRKTPKLKNTPENEELVRWLESRNIISSWSQNSVFTDDIRINLFYKPR